MIGLYLVQRPHIGRLGRLSAAAYAYSYVFFIGTVVYALVDGTSDYEALSHDLQPWMTIHGGVMVLAGLGFGVAVIRAKVLPRWTGMALMAGVVLVALSQTLPEGPQVLAAAIRDLGFAGMGAALLGAHPVSRHRRAAYPVGTPLIAKPPREGPVSGTVPAETAPTPALVARDPDWLPEEQHDRLRSPEVGGRERGGRLRRLRIGPASPSPVARHEQRGADGNLPRR